MNFVYWLTATIVGSVLLYFIFLTTLRMLEMKLINLQHATKQKNISKMNNEKDAAILRNLMEMDPDSIPMNGTQMLLMFILIYAVMLPFLIWLGAGALEFFDVIRAKKIHIWTIMGISFGLTWIYVKLYLYTMKGMAWRIENILSTYK